jgi:hypothetical protein
VRLRTVRNTAPPSATRAAAAAAPIAALGQSKPSLEATGCLVSNSGGPVWCRWSGVTMPSLGRAIAGWFEWSDPPVVALTEE